MSNDNDRAIPKIEELSEEDIKERSSFYRNSYKDEDGLIEALERGLGTNVKGR